MIRQRLGKDLLFFDGGMGTLLQEKGLAPGELPETWNLTHSEEIYKIHRQYRSRKRYHFDEYIWCKCAEVS